MGEIKTDSNPLIIFLITFYDFMQPNEYVSYRYYTILYYTMAKTKRTTEQTMIYKTLHRKLTIEQYELH